MNLEKVTVARADGNGQVGHFRSPSADTYLQLNVNAELNRTYTLHGYIKSDGNGTLSCLGKSVGTTASWNHFSIQIVPDSKIFSLVFSPGEYWFYNFKLEKGTIMTQWTPNGEDLVVVKQNIVSMGSSINQLNDKITQKVWMTEVNAAKGEVNAHLTNVEQTANKIDWLVKSGTDSSNMVLTDNAYSLIAKNIDLKGNATFSSFLDTSKTYINGGKIATGSITADQIATDAIKSKNYVANTSGSYLNLADGVFDSKNLKWDNEGSIISSKGTIGGWSIGENGLYNDNLNIGFINLGNFKLYIGGKGYDYMKNLSEGAIDSEHDYHPNFGVTSDGIVYSKDLYADGFISGNSIQGENLSISGTNATIGTDSLTFACNKNFPYISGYNPGGGGYNSGYAMYGWDECSDKAHYYGVSWKGSDSYIRFWVDKTNVAWIKQGTSDRRLKSNIQPIIQNYIDAISNVKLVQYNMRSADDKKLYFGAIAQDVKARLLEYKLNDENLNFILKEKKFLDDEEKYYSLDYEQFLILRLAGDEQYITRLKGEILSQNNRISLLETQIPRLQNQILQLLNNINGGK